MGSGWEGEATVGVAGRRAAFLRTPRLPAPPTPRLSKPTPPHPRPSLFSRLMLAPVDTVEVVLAPKHAQLVCAVACDRRCGPTPQAAHALFPHNGGGRVHRPLKYWWREMGGAVGGARVARHSHRASPAPPHLHKPTQSSIPPVSPYPSISLSLSLSLSLSRLVLQGRLVDARLLLQPDLDDLERRDQDQGLGHARHEACPRATPTRQVTVLVPQQA